MSDNWNGHEEAAEEQSPKTTPERAARASKFDTISHIVKSNYLFVGVEALFDDAKILHFKTSGIKLFYRGFSCRMVGEDGNNGVDFCISDFPITASS